MKISDLQYKTIINVNDGKEIGKTQSEIASELGVSRAQVSRIEKSAISNVKRLIK